MFNSVRINRVSEEIVEQIKKAVFQGKLKPGDKLPSERQLVEEFKASRVTIREALRSLELSGLLSIKKGAWGGAYVAEADFKPVSASLHNMLKLGKVSINDLTEARLSIEPDAARLAAQRATSKDLQILKELIASREKAIQARKLPQGHELIFHRKVAFASKNPVLFLIVDTVTHLLEDTVSHIRLTLEDNLKVIEFHKEIYQALEKKEQEKAHLIMRRHVIDIQRRLEQLQKRDKKVERP